MLNFNKLTNVNNANNEVIVTMRVSADGDLHIYYDNIWVAFVRKEDGSIVATANDHEENLYLNSRGIKTRNNYVNIE